MSETPDRIHISHLELTTREGSKVILTRKEAEDLYFDLKALFGKVPSVVINPAPIVVYPDKPWYPYPYHPAIWYGTSSVLDDNMHTFTGVIEHDSGLTFAMVGTPLASTI